MDKTIRNDGKKGEGNVLNLIRKDKDDRRRQQHEREGHQRQAEELVRELTEMPQFAAIGPPFGNQNELNHAMHLVHGFRVYATRGELEISYSPDRNEWLRSQKQMDKFMALMRGEAGRLTG